MRTLLVVTLVVICLASAALAQTTYTIVDLGSPLGGSSTFGLGINNAGQVVGQASTADDPSGCAPNKLQQCSHAFLISPPYTTMIDLGTLGGSVSTATAINASGQVVGGAFLADGSTERAFMISPPYTTMVDLGTLGGPASVAFGINDLGVVAGWAQLGAASSIRTHAVRFDPPYTTPVDLGTLGGNTSQALAINSSGLIAGTSNPTGSSDQHVMVIPTPGGTMLDLGTLGGSFVSRVAINDSGDIVGATSTSGFSGGRAFISSSPYTSLVELPTLGGSFSLADAINSSGQVVGNSTLVGDTTVHGFLYSSATGIVDLDSLLPAGSGWSTFEGHGINDKGQITGFGTNPDGFFHAFVLSPPANTLSALVNTVLGFNLAYGIANSLLAKLSAAQVFAGVAAASATRTSTGTTSSKQSKSSCNQLSAFIHEVQAQSGKKLTSSQASQLIRMAQDVLAAQKCS